MSVLFDDIPWQWNRRLQSRRFIERRGKVNQSSVVYAKALESASSGNLLIDDG